jgi:hypothetical protein
VLAGGVVVILGYASGIGIIPTDAATAAPPATQPPAATAPAVPATTPPPATTIAQPALPGTSTMPDMEMPADSPQPATAGPEPTPSPTEPEPIEPDATCGPSVLEGVPAVGQLTSSLLSSVVSSTPVVSDLAGPPVEGQAAGPLSCLVGTLVGPTCCTTTTATAEDPE